MPTSDFNLKDLIANNFIVPVEVSLPNKNVYLIGVVLMLAIAIGIFAGIKAAKML
jgi:hypothetical protein